MNILSLFTHPHVVLNQGCPNSVLEGRCLAEFSSNPNQTHLKKLIKVLLGILETSMQVCWSKLELNSAGRRPSRTEFGQPCAKLSFVEHKMRSFEECSCSPFPYNKSGWWPKLLSTKKDTNKISIYDSRTIFLNLWMSAWPCERDLLCINVSVISQQFHIFKLATFLVRINCVLHHWHQTKLSCYFISLYST